MLAFTFIFSAFIISYCLGLLYLKHGLKKQNLSQNSAQPFLSVIVSARNEEGNIATCIDHLLAQDYEPANYEVIIVDDRSEDKTERIIQRFVSDYRLKLIQISPENISQSPKKHAIATAIKQAKGEIIVTTDADCTPPVTWLSTLVKNFTPEVGMVAGFNPYKVESNNVFQKMLALDYFSMAAVAAATAGINFPVSCTGGNLAYRKNVYEEVGGFTQHSGLTSGDDDLFLEQIREKTDWKIVYCTDSKSFVQTKPPENLKAFVQQRIRYASKGRHYKWNVTIGLIWLYLMNLFFTFSPIIILFQPEYFLLILSGFTLKTIGEFRFLKKASGVFEHHLSLLHFIATAIVHPGYITLAGIGGQFFSIRWKG